VSQSSWTTRDANNKLGEEEKNRANVTLQVNGITGFINSQN